MKPVLLVVMASVMFGLIGLFVKNIQDVSGNEIVMFRFLIGFLVVAAVMLVTGRKIARPLSRLFIINSVVYGVWVAFYINSLTMGTSLGNAAFLLYTAVVFSVIFSRFITREYISRNTAIAMAVALAGVFLILKPSIFFSHYGQLFALAAGVLYGLSMTIVRRLQRDFDTYSIVFYSFLLPLVFLVPLGMMSFTIPDFESSANIVLLAVLATTVPVLLLTHSLRKLKAFESLTIGLLEPIVAAVIGFLLFSEFLDMLSILGGAMILFSSFYINRIIRAQDNATKHLKTVRYKRI